MYTSLKEEKLEINGRKRLKDVKEENARDKKCFWLYAFACLLSFYFHSSGTQQILRIENITQKINQYLIKLFIIALLGAIFCLFVKLNCHANPEFSFVVKRLNVFFWFLGTLNNEIYKYKQTRIFLCIS